MIALLLTLASFAGCTAGGLWAISCVRRRPKGE